MNEETARLHCPLCKPRPDDSVHWIRIGTLSAATLYLDRNQTYRGHCQLVFDPRHAEGLERLEQDEYTMLMADLSVAARAIHAACQPDLMNYASLGNVVRHVHWHIVPRYRNDARWGSPIYTTELADMRQTRLAEAEYLQLVADIRGHLDL